MELTLVALGIGMVVTVICLAGLHAGLPWPAIVTGSAVTAGAVALLLAYAAVAGDGENVASLVSSAVLGASYGAGCAVVVGLIARGPDAT